MQKRAIAIGLTALTMTAAAVQAQGGSILQAGEYEVSMRLELPFVEDTASKLARVCVTEGDGGTHGLAVLSDNNPLGKCPASNVRQNGDTLSFDIICPGGNAAVASARYTVSPQRFTGAIKMKMGGKNMTMTERQTGHRIGNCKAADSPRS